MLPAKTMPATNPPQRAAKISLKCCTFIDLLFSLRFSSCQKNQDPQLHGDDHAPYGNRGRDLFGFALGRVELGTHVRADRGSNPVCEIGKKAHLLPAISSVLRSLPAELPK